MLSYRAAHDVAVRFTLAEVFFEILNREIRPHYIHFQVYGINELFRQTLKAMVPSPLRQRGLLNAVESRFYLLQGFLNSGDSGHLELTINASHANKDEVHIRGVNNPGSLRIAKQAQSLLRKRLSRFGFIPWLYLKMVPLGRSFHLGGSFPTGGKDAVFTSDTMGRPAGLQFVHLLDASTFPSIAASTITYTAMANADRVVRETHKQGRLA
jgi:choline dehydrogenase-like flavoprotein